VQDPQCENTNFRATSIETLRQMVAANAGITLMPELAIGNRTGPVRYIPFRGAPPHRTIGIAWRDSAARGELLNRLAEVIVARPGRDRDFSARLLKKRPAGRTYHARGTTRALELGENS
jgi:DNA-binding transcriptional LysR family regulator